MREEVGNVHIGQSNLIYLVDRFASEDDVTEVNMQEIAPENKDGRDEAEMLNNYLRSAAI